jgi:hypothetical protein
LYKNQFLYSSINHENKKERKFHDFLEISGYIVKYQEIKFIKNEEEKKFGGNHNGIIRTPFRQHPDSLYDTSFSPFSKNYLL